MLQGFSTTVTFVYFSDQLQEIRTPSGIRNRQINGILSSITQVGHNFGISRPFESSGQTIAAEPSGQFY